MASKKARFFMGFMAILFLVTASATTIAVIWDAVSNKGTNNSNQAKEQNVEGKLTGTQLQGFTPTSTPLTQLQTTDTKVGEGQEVKAGDTVTADYVGALMSNGKIFDASKDHGGAVSFPLSGVIQGWQQGIPGMKVGGTRRLLIPAALGYGAQGNAGIPPNADLVFDVTITKVGQ